MDTNSHVANRKATPQKQIGLPKKSASASHSELDFSDLLDTLLAPTEMENHLPPPPRLPNRHRPVVTETPPDSADIKLEKLIVIDSSIPPKEPTESPVSPLLSPTIPMQVGPINGTITNAIISIIQLMPPPTYVMQVTINQDPMGIMAQKNNGGWQITIMASSQLKALIDCHINDLIETVQHKTGASIKIIILDHPDSDNDSDDRGRSNYNEPDTEINAMNDNLSEYLKKGEL